MKFLQFQSNKPTYQTSSVHKVRMSVNRIHIMGAPGAGITTLGKSLASALDFMHFDADDYHWFTTDPEPYRRKRNPDHRRKLLSEDLQKEKNWILTGSICDWGTIFAPQFQAIIFCTAPTTVRLERIKERELARYGNQRLTNGGDLQIVFEKFVDWAAAYETNMERSRSLIKELEWVHQFCNCPVLQLNTASNHENYTDQVQSWLNKIAI